jgi:putative transcriptional regulator
MDRDQAMKANKKKYRSSPLRSLPDAAKDLYTVGAIDKTTMRQFDVACLTPVARLKPQAIRRLRTDARMSQSIFALALNVTTSLVSQWERGEKKPSGPSLKLLALAEKKGIQAIL